MTAQHVLRTSAASSHETRTRPARPGLISGLALAAALSACGGGSTSDPAAAGDAAAQVSASAGDAVTSAPGLDVVAAVEAQPTYHLAPVAVPEPGDSDATGLAATANAAPLALPVSGTAAALATARLVPEDLQAALAGAGERARTLAAQDGGTVRALAASTTATVYTPAQISAAYGLAQLPAASTANKGAYQGSGQTIYIIDAFHNPNIANDLAVFNQKFGLPTCTSVAIPVTAALPLKAPAAGSGCTFSVVYAAKASRPVGAMGTAAPAVDKGWVVESSMDVEWAHAIAPLARIVLIEAQSASGADLMAAVDLANKMGPGVVSMSFGAGEFDYASQQYWGAPMRSAAAAAMTYVAANGDYGSQAQWPAVDAQVLSVGGTRLAWNGAVRSEAVWSSTGGAISKQVPVPSYQASIRKPGAPTAAGAKIYRGSTDVAFNADPYSGQYVYVTPSTTTGGTGWISAGGTSVGAPQWAGLVAVANAARALGSKAPLGLVQPALYKAFAAVPGTYASTFNDITTGSNGSCGAMCTAATQYDLPTGLGTPRAADLVSRLAAY